jgi:hypothetical protein
MASLDMTAGLGTTLRGFELDQAYNGSKNVSGQRHGHGTYQFPNKCYEYEGDFVHGEAHGQGRLTMGDGGYYQGEFANGEISGHGTRRWGTGKVFVGVWDNGEMHGEGVVTFPGGDTFTGTFVRNVREGTGSLRLANGGEYEGEWLLGKKHGKGVETCVVDNSKETYTGDFANGNREGFGETKNSEGGAWHSGGWRDGKKHGAGKQFDSASGVSYEGAFENDLPANLPVLLEVDARGPKAHEGDEEPPIVGTVEVPLSLTAGESLGANGSSVVLRARLAPVVLPKENENEYTGDPAEGTATDAYGAEGTPTEPEVVLGDVATHESGRVFRCLLTTGAPTIVETARRGNGTADPTDENEAPNHRNVEETGPQTHEPARLSLAFGPEIPLAPDSNPMSFDAAFTANGVASLDFITTPKTLAEGVYTLRVVDATPGKYGDLARLPDTFFVMQVQEAPETLPEETAEGDGEAA